MIRLIEYPNNQWLGKVVCYRNGDATYMIESFDSIKNVIVMRIMRGRKGVYYASPENLWVVVKQHDDPGYKFYYDENEFVGVLVVHGSSAKHRCIVRKDTEDIPSKEISFLMAWAIMHSNKTRTQTKKELYATVDLAIKSNDDSKTFDTTLRGVLMERFMATGGSKELYQELLNEPTS